MEPKVIYLLLALHTALSVKYGANVQKKSDSTSDMRSQKMLIRKNYSEKLYEKELTKLQTDIELYKQKIKTRQNERKILENKILRRMPQKCKKINCPLDERPVCAKFFYKNRNSPPFYVSMINECEINYMKCHRGLESTIVPMENCHSVIGNLYLSDQSEKKRSKRSVKADPLMTKKYNAISSTLNKTVIRNKYNVKTNQPHQKLLPIAKSATSNKTTKSNVKTTTLNDKLANEKVLDLKSSIFSKKTNVPIKKTILATRNKINLKQDINTTLTRNKTKLKIGSDKNVKTSKKIHFKSKVAKRITQKLRNETKLNLKTKPFNETKPKSKVNKINTAHKAVSKSNQTSNSKTNTRQKNNAPKRVNVIKNTKKTSAGKPILRQDAGGSIEKLHGEQFFEENIGKEKMFTLDMFWKANAQQLDQVVNAELNNDGSSIQGSIEIDDDFINVNKVVPQKPKDDDLIDLNKNENQNSSENIELTIETDDADLEKTLGNENVPESEYDSPEIKGTIEIDDKDLNLNHGTNGNEQEENKFDKEVVFNGELKSKYSNLVSKEDFIAGEIELDDENNKLNPKNPVDPGEIKSDESNPKQHLQEIEDQETEELPLVEEPIVDEFEPFHEEEEYHYEPEAMPPIVILDADQRDKKENENVKNSKPPVGGDNPLIVPPKTGNADGSIGDAGGGIIDAKNNENNNKNIGGDDAPGGDEPIPFPDDKNNGDDEVDMEEYNAECPRQCPARDMMVCALCQHGIYKTFLSICHMRMYQCQGNTHEQLELVSRFPCVMSAPLITEDPPMQPVGRVSEPNDQDRVLRYVRCREKGLLGKSPKCTFEDTENINQEIIVTEVSPVEY